MTSRLRSDVHLRYLYCGARRGGSGRPKTYDGRVSIRQLRPDVFTPCAKCDKNTWIAYEAVVNVKALKGNCCVVVVHDLDASGKIKGHRVYFSTDQLLSGGEVLHQYQCRFQQEFLYRDAKQELGLTHGQAYSWPKIDFHVNTALTVGSLAKAAHHLADPNKRCEPFSIADIKTRYTNEYQVDRILSAFRIDRNDPLISQQCEELYNLGLRRA